MTSIRIFNEILQSYGFIILEDSTLVSNKTASELIKSVINCDSELEKILSSLVMRQALAKTDNGQMDDSIQSLEINSKGLMLSFAYIEEGLSYLSLKAGNRDLACKLAEKAAAYNSECANKEAYTHYLMGSYYVELKNFKEAINSLNASLKLEKENTHAHVLLGKAYNGLAEYYLAEEKFKKALDSSPRSGFVPQPENIDFLRNHEMAMFYYGNSKFDDAIPFFEKCIRLNPKDPMLYLKAEYCYENIGKYFDALQCIRFGLMNCPENKALKSLEKRLNEKIF